MGRMWKNKLQQIQNRAARIIDRSSWYSLSDENLTRLNLKNNVAIMIYKIVSKQAPEYLVDRLIFADHTYMYSTCSRLYNVKNNKTKDWDYEKIF